MPVKKNDNPLFCIPFCWYIKLGNGIDGTAFTYFVYLLKAEFCSSTLCMLLYLSQNWVPTEGKAISLVIFVFPPFIFTILVMIALHYTRLKFSLTYGFGSRASHRQKGIGQLLDGSPPSLRISLSFVFTLLRY